MARTQGSTVIVPTLAASVVAVRAIVISQIGTICQIVLSFTALGIGVLRQDIQAPAEMIAIVRLPACARQTALILNVHFVLENRILGILITKRVFAANYGLRIIL